MKKVFSILGILIIAFIIILVITPSGQNKDIPGRTDLMVNDYAGIMNVQIKSALEQELQAYKKNHPLNIEIIISIFKTTGDIPFRSFVDQHALNWRKAWGFEKDRRSHIDLVMDTQRISIGVGEGLDHLATPQDTSRIIDEAITPEFTQGNISLGLQKGAKALMKMFE